MATLVIETFLEKKQKRVHKKSGKQSRNTFANNRKCKIPIMGQFRKVYRKDTITQIGCFCFLLTIALSHCVLFTSKAEKGNHNNQNMIFHNEIKFVLAFCIFKCHYSYQVKGKVVLF